MAHFLVAGNGKGIAMRLLVEQAVGQLIRDGHQAETETDLATVAACDATIAIIDGTVLPETSALLAAAKATQKPTLVLRGPGAPLFDGLLRGLMDAVHDGDDTDTLLLGLAPFYDRVRPFAGRLVRDHVPRLVRESGHDIRFRELDAKERPRFLKQKLAAEAGDLLAASAGAEKEEIADVLEVLEALIRERGYDRDGLKQVKLGKHKRRGGFERCYVVEAEGAAAAPPAPASPTPAARTPPQPAAATPAAPPPAPEVPVKARAGRDWPEEQRRPKAPAPHLDPTPRPRSAAEALIDEVDAEAEAIAQVGITDAAGGPPRDYDGPVWNADDDAATAAVDDVAIDTIDAQYEPGTVRRPASRSGDDAADQDRPRRLF